MFKILSWKQEIQVQGFISYNPGDQSRLTHSLSRDVVNVIAQIIKKTILKHAVLMNDGKKPACGESSSFFKGRSLHSSALPWIFTSVNKMTR